MTTPTEPIAVERCRPFSLADAMIFVAAAAFGLWLAKGDLVRVWEILWSPQLATWDYVTRSRWDVLATLVFYLLDAGWWMLMVLAATFLAVRLRRPRPPLARMVIQPGMVAFEAQILAYGLILAIVIGRLGVDEWILLGMFLSAMPLAWGVLAWNGRWRREPGWIDLLGIGLGFGVCLEMILWLVFLIFFPG